eukprot:gnl/TRDRNA2_/TRDRNA2_139188_c1_seq1.p2 gnl/TRDRNA2_/TRDRNA2_139188_c1~~gnl/TRDRNA2_/TRDRNA2_139188_c1_seq1.p2  ORF type:complete len:307 (+),score=55.57 gnl/TRDRNA2_/TRDRNA2_139188_c1_seq1:1250-2170(+)
MLRPSGGSARVFFSRRGQTKGFIPLARLGYLLQNEAKPAHPEHRVTEDSLAASFQGMSMDQSQWLMRMLEEEAVQHQQEVDAQEEASSAKDTARTVDLMDSRIRGMELSLKGIQLQLTDMGSASAKMERKISPKARNTRLTPDDSEKRGYPSEGVCSTSSILFDTNGNGSSSASSSALRALLERALFEVEGWEMDHPQQEMRCQKQPRKQMQASSNDSQRLFSGEEVDPTHPQPQAPPFTLSGLLTSPASVTSDDVCLQEEVRRIARQQNAQFNNLSRRLEQQAEMTGQLQSQLKLVAAQLEKIAS